MSINRIMNKKITLSILLMLSTTALSAQDSAMKLGVRLGGGISVSKDMGKVLVPEDYYSNYEFKDKMQVIPSIGVYAHYHKAGSLFGADGGIVYYQKASKLHYSDNMELNYDVTTRYSHLGLEGMFRFYPWRNGFSVSAGGRVSAILNPKGLRYESNQEDEKFASFAYGSASETERIMRDKLTGRPDVAIGGGLGYEFGHWLIDARYFYGVTSGIKTELNDFNWIDRNIHSHNIELGVSYLFDL